MNDGILYTYEVISNQSDRAEHICARKETAEYLADWCNALVEQTIRSLEEAHPSIDWTTTRRKAEVYGVEEGEVIL